MDLRSLVSTSLTGQTFACITGKAAYEAGIQVPASAEVLLSESLFTGVLVSGCLVDTNSFT